MCYICNVTAFILVKNSVVMISRILIGHHFFKETVLSLPLCQLGKTDVIFNSFSANKLLSAAMSVGSNSSIIYKMLMKQLV